MWECNNQQYYIMIIFLFNRMAVGMRLGRSKTTDKQLYKIKTGRLYDLRCVEDNVTYSSIILLLSTTSNDSYLGMENENSIHLIQSFDSSKELVPIYPVIFPIPLLMPACFCGTSASQNNHIKLHCRKLETRRNRGGED